MARLYPQRYPRGAIQGFGRSMMQVGMMMAEVGSKEQAEEERLQYETDMAKAGAFEVTWWDGIKGSLLEFEDKPEEAMKHLERKFSELEKGTLGEMTSEESKADMNNYLIEYKEKKKAEISEWVRTQQKINQDVNYEVARSEALKSKIWLGVDDLADSLTYYYEQLETSDLLDTFQSQIKDYLLQSGDEKYINNPNLFVEENGLNIPDAERELFGSADMAKLKSEYKTRKSINEYQAKAKKEKRENEVLMTAYGFAEKGDFSSGLEEIKQARDDLGAESYGDALNKYQNAFRILNDTGVNVYKDTQNWKLYWEDLQRAIDKKITEKELREHVGENGYSVAQFKEIKSILDGTSSKTKAFEDTAAAKDLKKVIDSFIEPKLEAELNLYASNIGMGLLRDAITPDMTEREKKETALRISRQLKQDKLDGTLGKGLDEMIINRPPKKKGALHSRLKPSEFVKKPTRDEFIRYVASLKQQGKMKEAREYYDKWADELWQ